MKKKIKYLLFAVLCNLFVVRVYAASSVSLKISPSSSRVQVGDTITATVSVSSKQPLGAWQFNVGYNSSVLKYVSSNMENGLTSLGYVSNTTTKTKTYTLKFKAKAAGTGNITINNASVYGLDDSLFTNSISNASITVVAQKTSNSNSNSNSNKEKNDTKKSTNNYLDSLSVDGYSISPKFNKNTTKYNISVPNNIRTVKINANSEDKKATVNGTGNKNLKEGKNKFEIVVTAENGNKKTYVLNVTVQDKEPVIVKVNGEDYTVMQSSEGLNIPESYSKTTVTINDTVLPAYKSGLTGFTLVGLTDKNGKSNLYVYSDNKYTLYNEFKFNGISIYIKEPKVMVKGAKETTLTLDDEEIKAYTIDGNSYPLIYGMNIESGEENWYTYDSSEKTLQKFIIGNKNSAKGISITQNVTSNDKYRALSYMMCGISGILTLFLILSAVKISKQNKPEI